MIRNTTLFKLLLFFVSFVMTSNSFSQIDSSYVPFPTDSVAWKESGNYLINIDPYETETYSNFIFLIGDTVIDSLTYSKVYVGREIFDIHDSHTFIKGGLREENKKIYFKDFSTPSLPEKLYYDFTLNIGDSIYWNGYFCCRLEFIDSLQMVDGSFRKRYNYSGGFPMQVVEGIGSTYVPAGGLLHPNSTFFFENSNMISCVVKPDEEIYIYNYDTANDYNCYSLTSPLAPVDSNYVPFPKDSVAWNETETFLDSDLQVQTYNKYLFLVGDTILDSVNYSALYKGKKVFDIDDNSTQLYGGIRVDNKKVFFKKHQSSEKLLFDYNLLVGDSFNFDPYGAKELQSIDSIEINDGTYRKRYNFESLFIVEGIGFVTTLSSAYNYSGLLERGHYYIGVDNRLNCVITPNKVLYKNDNIQDHNCYGLGVSINELEEHNQLIYPNPFENVLNFTEESTASKVVVYSISGSIVFEEINFSGSTLDLSFLEKGIYYLKVKAERNYYQKIVKL